MDNNTERAEATAAGNAPRFYGWVTTGNQRTELYKVIDSTGAPLWTRAHVSHSEPLGQHATFSERIASECVTGYEQTPEFCFASERATLWIESNLA